MAAAQRTAQPSSLAKGELLRLRYSYSLFVFDRAPFENLRVGLRV